MAIYVALGFIGAAINVEPGEANVAMVVTLIPS